MSIFSSCVANAVAVVFHCNETGCWRGCRSGTSLQLIDSHIACTGCQIHGTVGLTILSITSWHLMLPLLASAVLTLPCTQLLWPQYLWFQMVQHSPSVLCKSLLAVVCLHPAL